MSIEQRFGPLLRETRQKNEISLKGAVEGVPGFDAGRLSLIERSNAIPPTAKVEQLDQLLRQCGVEPGSDIWRKLKNEAYLSVGRLPPSVTSDSAFLDKISKLLEEREESS